MLKVYLYHDLKGSRINFDVENIVIVDVNVFSEAVRIIAIY